MAEKLGPNSWVIYRHDFSLALNLPRLWLFPLNFFLFSDFLDDAKNGNLPAYSFIEPRYLPDVDLPNDQHPPHGVTAGEQLIATVYNALRKGPQWTSTLLIITYDEHGGCYDHVPPPAATSPDMAKSSPFNFDRYGVRVPAVIVSPYIKAGTILRAPKGSPPFDHTSVMATLRNRFGLGAPLTHRDAAAPDLGSASDMWLKNFGQPWTRSHRGVTGGRFCRSPRGFTARSCQRSAEIDPAHQCKPSDAGSDGEGAH